MRASILALALLLGSCATVDYETADAAACTSPQTPPGSYEYVSCRRALADQRAESARAANARFSALAGAMAGAGRAAPAQSVHSPQPMRTTCFKRGEYSSGMNKICNYNCLGSAYAMTVSVAELCPLTTER